MVMTWRRGMLRKSIIMDLISISVFSHYFFVNIKKIYKPSLFCRLKGCAHDFIFLAIRILKLSSTLYALNSTISRLNNFSKPCFFPLGQWLAHWQPKSYQSVIIVSHSQKFSKTFYWIVELQELSPLDFAISRPSQFKTS